MPPYTLTGLAPKLYTRWLKPEPLSKSVWVIDGTCTETQPSDDIYDKVYLGAHFYEITEDEAAVLRSAGYTVYD